MHVEVVGLNASETSFWWKLKGTKSVDFKLYVFCNLHYTQETASCMHTTNHWNPSAAQSFLC